MKVIGLIIFDSKSHMYRFLLLNSHITLFVSDFEVLPSDTVNKFVDQEWSLVKSICPSLIPLDLIRLIYCVLRHFQQYFNYIMATRFSGGRSRNTRGEPPTMGKQLVNFIICGFQSSAPFLLITKPGANPRRIGDRLV